MRIVLVRHGESETNKMNKELINDHMDVGQINVKLTDVGKEMARDLRNNGYITQMQKIYSSDLDRALETAKLATNKADIETDKRLRERTLGLFEGILESKLSETYPEYFNNPKYINYKNDFIVKAPAGENLTEVSNRCEDFLGTLDLKQNITIGIFSHNLVIKCFIYVLTNIEKEDVVKLKIHNCEPIVLVGDTIGKFKLESHTIDELLL